MRNLTLMVVLSCLAFPVLAVAQDFRVSAGSPEMRAYAPYAPNAAATANLLRQPAPPAAAQMLGPDWRGRSVDVEGRVMALDGRCREIDVFRGGVPGAGRLWACFASPSVAPGMGDRVRVGGRVAGTRMTRMANHWRVVPVVDPVRYDIRRD